MSLRGYWIKIVILYLGMFLVIVDSMKICRNVKMYLREWGLNS